MEKAEGNAKEANPISKKGEDLYTSEEMKKKMQILNSRNKKKK